MESDVFAALSRLMAVVGRVVTLARFQQQTVIIVMVCILLDMICRLMEAIEKVLQE